MGLRPNPTQRQRRLGAELRRLREASGLSAAEAGRHANLSKAHMSHVEVGRTAIPEPKLRALAAAYGCNDKPLIEALIAMAQSNGKGWWAEYKPLLGNRACDLAELESMATAARSFEWLYVPGLLQTPAYMRAVFMSDDGEASADEIDRYVEFRQRRQQVLAHESPLHLQAVIHEAAFHMHFVGRDIMREQIEHLIELSRLPHLQIQLLPFKAPAGPPTPGSPFAILDCTVPGLRTVYVEQPVSSAFFGGEEHISRFAAAFDRLSGAALAPLVPTSSSRSHARDESLGLAQHLLYIL